MIIAVNLRKKRKLRDVKETYPRSYTKCGAGIAPTLPNYLQCSETQYSTLCVFIERELGSLDVLCTILFRIFVVKVVLPKTVKWFCSALGCGLSQCMLTRLFSVK